jgi:hypothetical protein
MGEEEFSGTDDQALAIADTALGVSAADAEEALRTRTGKSAATDASAIRFCFVVWRTKVLIFWYS